MNTLIVDDERPARDELAFLLKGFPEVNLIAQGKAKPMVAVMPLGYGDMAVAAKQPSDPDFGRLFVANNALFGNVLLTEIVPHVESEYRVTKTREGKAIAGLSMGGAQSLDIGLNGTGKDGTGSLTTQSATLKDTPYGYNARFGDGKGTNPEELIAAAHAGCFTMALAFQLQSAGFTPAELATEAAVSLDPEGQGFRISRSALTLRASVRNLDEATFTRLAGLAEKNCPVSKVLNAEITLDAKLV